MHGGRLTRKVFWRTASLFLGDAFNLPGLRIHCGLGRVGPIVGQQELVNKKPRSNDRGFFILFIGTFILRVFPPLPSSQHSTSSRHTPLAYFGI